MNNSFYDFTPALIVEATSVCDRSCPGCYAPNVVSKLSSENLFAERPDLFLDPHKLDEILSKVNTTPNEKIGIASIRGGEPTRHPNLLAIVELLSHSAEKVFIETHGRWIVDLDTNYADLLDGCRKNRTVIKLSFDKMHDGASLPLRKITDTLDKMKIGYLIAITESSEHEFLLTRAICYWVPNSKISFQKKAVKVDELIMPEIGVVRVNGTFSHTLNSKISFKTNSRTELNGSEAIA